MRFPIIGDIASTSVDSVSIEASVSEAIEMMLLHEHRSVIVEDGDLFRILTVVEVLDIESRGMNLKSSLKNFDLTLVPTIYKGKNVLESLEFLNSSMEYICTVNEDGSLHGLVTHTDITSNIDPDTLMDNYTLQDFLKLGRRMKWVDKDEITSKLLKDMVKNKFDNSIIVEDLKPIGILTTKDVMKLIRHQEELDLPVSRHMSKPVDTILNTSSIKQALEFVKLKHYKRVVVVDEDGKLAGTISQKELISLTYSRWAILMKEYQEELSEINHILENQNKEYEVKASVDSLTGLYNRHKFTELYISSYTSMVQRDNTMSLVLIDIDFFKKVNDTYGHNGGDRVLVEVSRLLLRLLRNIDIVARWGGEEFIILLPTAAIDSAKTISEKIRKSLEDLSIDVIGHISASFGVAEVRKNDTMENVIERADKALYLAKKCGRNCVRTENDLKS